MRNPKVFISYSWSNPEHENWILDFATELVDSGVNVILDKWDLKEGHDANAFMEQMISDPEIKKVIIVCDKKYVEKADKRQGGAGTEAQIISSEIYKKQKQDKFVAVIKEKDDNGNAYLPIYYKSRIYIDLSEPEAYEKNFERLLRWIYDKPLYIKPEIGTTPSFLEAPTSLRFPTSSIYRKVVESLKNHKNYAEGTLDDYFNIIIDNFEILRIDYHKNDFDDKVIESIESFLPFRNELINVFLLVARYRDNEETRSILHRFFENLIPFLFKPVHLKQYNKWDFDNFRFIIHELFLYLVGILIKYERFETASYLMRNYYYVEHYSDFGRESMVSFRVFRQYMESLEYRNKRLKKNRLSIRADLLSKRCTNSQIKFRHLMQADFVLFLRDHLQSSIDDFHWWPETLIFADRLFEPFEIFIRSQSKEYFNRAKKLFDIETKEKLENLVDSFQENRRRLLPRWGYESLDPVKLIGIEKIAIRP